MFYFYLQTYRNAGQIMRRDEKANRGVQDVYSLVPLRPSTVFTLKIWLSADTFFFLLSTCVSTKLLFKHCVFLTQKL